VRIRGFQSGNGCFRHSRIFTHFLQDFCMLFGGRAERMVRGNLRMTAKHDIRALGACRFRHLAPVAFPETSN
jgi:hypothetical protein